MIPATPRPRTSGWLVDLGLDALAVHRLARLVTEDGITAPLRERIIGRSYLGRPLEEHETWTSVALDDGHSAPKLAQLITCRWCSSVWIGAGAMLGRRYAPRAWDTFARLMALSSLGTLVGGLEE